MDSYEPENLSSMGSPREDLASQHPHNVRYALNSHLATVRTHVLQGFECLEHVPLTFKAVPKGTTVPV